MDAHNLPPDPLKRCRCGQHKDPWKYRCWRCERGIAVSSSTHWRVQIGEACEFAAARREERHP
jgi:hypothetical protein